VSWFFAGTVSNLVYFVGNPGTFPIDPDTTTPWRAGDYSAIVYSDDGFFYASSENSYANPSNSRFPDFWKWGKQSDLILGSGSGS
jgi:hypothetical protein